jgi:hypothetical protein
VCYKWADKTSQHFLRDVGSEWHYAKK